MSSVEPYEKVGDAFPLDLVIVLESTCDFDRFVRLPIARSCRAHLEVF